MLIVKNIYASVLPLTLASLSTKPKPIIRITSGFRPPGRSGGALSHFDGDGGAYAFVLSEVNLSVVDDWPLVLTTLTGKGQGGRQWLSRRGESIFSECYCRLRLVRPVCTMMSCGIDFAPKPCGGPGSAAAGLLRHLAFEHKLNSTHPVDSTGNSFILLTLCFLRVGAVRCRAV